MAPKKSGYAGAESSLSGRETFLQFYVDALSEMIDARVKEKDLIILKEEKIVCYKVKRDTAGVTHLVQNMKDTDCYQENVAKAEMSFSLYLIEKMAEKFLEE
jgi:hypothetical protein